jgi:hypothetical protein
VEYPQNGYRLVAKFVAHNVACDAEFSNFVGLVLAQPLTSPRELQQRPRTSDKPIEYVVRRIEIMLCQEVIQPAQIRLSCA